MKTIFGILTSWLVLGANLAIASDAPKLFCRSKTEVMADPGGSSDVLKSYSELTTQVRDGNTYVVVAVYLQLNSEPAKVFDGFAIRLGEVKRGRTRTLLKGIPTPAAGLGVLNFELVLMHGDAQMKVTIDALGEKSELDYAFTCPQ